MKRVFIVHGQGFNPKINWYPWLKKELESKQSRFDRWCRKNKILHIRTRVKRPQTNGKVERLFQTIKKEISFCNKDLEQFRYRYNHFRPHESLNWQTPSEVFNDFNKNMYW